MCPIYEKQRIKYLKKFRNKFRNKWKILKMIDLKI